LVIDATALGLKKIRKKRSEKIQKAKSPAHMLILYVFGFGRRSLAALPSFLFRFLANNKCLAWLSAAEVLQVSLNLVGLGLLNRVSKIGNSQSFQ